MFSASSIEGQKFTLRGRNAWIIVFIAGVLLVSGGFKLLLFAPTKLLISRAEWFVLLQISVEWGLAFWLLSGRRQVGAYASAVLAFAGFGLVAVWKVYRGSANCGCFGPLRVPPVFTASLDLVVLLLLGRSQSSFPSLSRFRHLARVSFASITICLVLTQLHHGGAAYETDAVQLDPKDWAGKPCPLLNHLVVEPDLRHSVTVGTWTLLVYDHTCDLCRTYVASCGTSTRMDGGNGPNHCLLVDISVDTKPAEMRGFKRATLAQDAVWLADIPTEVCICDGIVTNVKEIHP